MASTNGNRYTLSVKPVDYSLTAGTNIPAPLDSPPQSPASGSGSARPPTPGGGPLTSHPTTPEDIPGAFPPTPEPEKESVPKLSTYTSATNTMRNDSFRTPISPASATPTQNTSSPEPQRKPSGIRKLLSLSSLRSSFSSSRTSLSLPRQSNEVQQQQQQQAPNLLKRPSSPSIASTTQSSYYQPRPDLRKKKSGNWLRRKSQIFMLNGDNTLEAVVETQRPESQRPDTRDSKRLKEEPPTPAPLLPEIGTLNGGGFGGGEIGWDEGMFKR